jgi:membrane protein
MQLFTFFPLMLLVFTLLSMAIDPVFMAEYLRSALVPILPVEVHAIVQDFVTNILADANFSLVSFAGLVLAYAVLRAIMQNSAILNDLLDVRENRKLWLRIFDAILTFCAFLLLCLGVVKFAFIGYGSVALGYALPVFSIWLATFILYFFGPNLKEKKRAVVTLVASLVFTLVFLLISQIFKSFVAYFLVFNLAYGVLGVIVLLLIYLQLISYVYLWAVLLLKKLLLTYNK